VVYVYERTEVIKMPSDDSESTPLGKVLPKTGEAKSYLPTIGFFLSMILMTLIWMKKKTKF
ncbi:LPXTG cell wall anchor domain-containing protein, partial [Enterococcus faecalis]